MCDRATNRIAKQKQDTKQKSHDETPHAEFIVDLNEGKKKSEANVITLTD